MEENRNRHNTNRQTSKKSAGRRRRRLLLVLAILGVVMLLSALALRHWIRTPDLENEPSLEDAELPDIARSGRKDGIYTFLLAGQDVTSGSTDTMLLISYDINEKTIYGLNLPRDTMIDTESPSKRLNAVYNYNKGKDKDTQAEKGMTALKKQVARLTGIMPDFYVLVQWEAIGELVDAIGGVKFEVPFDMDYDDPYQDLHIHQKAGLRKLDGNDAMQVIRHRKNNDGSHSGGDVARLAIQQDFLKVVAKKCLQPATFLKAPSLAKIFVENVKTDLTVGNILAFAQKASGMDPDTGVIFQTAPLADSFLYRGAALVTLDPEGVLEVVNDGMNPYQRDIQLSDLEILCRSSNGRFSITSGSIKGSAIASTKSDEPKSSVKDKDEETEPIIKSQSSKNTVTNKTKQQETIQEEVTIKDSDPVENVPTEPTKSTNPVEPEPIDNGTQDVE